MNQFSSLNEVNARMIAVNCLLYCLCGHTILWEIRKTYFNKLLSIVLYKSRTLYC